MQGSEEKASNENSEICDGCFLSHYHQRTYLLLGLLLALMGAGGYFHPKISSLAPDSNRYVWAILLLFASVLVLPRKSLGFLRILLAMTLAFLTGIEMDTLIGVPGIFWEWKRRYLLPFVLIMIGARVGASLDKRRLPHLWTGVGLLALVILYLSVVRETRQRKLIACLAGVLLGMSLLMAHSAMITERFRRGLRDSLCPALALYFDAFCLIFYSFTALYCMMGRNEGEISIPFATS